MYVNEETLNNDIVVKTISDYYHCVTVQSNLHLFNFYSNWHKGGIIILLLLTDFSCPLWII